MARPVKWSRELPAIRARAARSRTETWSRQDVEHLFSVGRVSAQSLMKAIGEVQTVGAAHFVDRSALLVFLDQMIAAESAEELLRAKLAGAEPAPKPKTLRVALPVDLRQAMLPDLPPNVKLSPGRIEIEAASAIAMVEALLALAMVMQNDLERWQQHIEPPASGGRASDDDLKAFLSHLRDAHATQPEAYPAPD